MKLMDKEWNGCQNKYEHLWVADTESELTSNFDKDSAVGSMVLVIATKATWMKNSAGKWQKCGTGETK